MNIHQHIFIFIISLSNFIFAQTAIEPDKIKSFNITVNYPEYTVKTQMLKDFKKVTPKNDLTYHWYTSQKIQETRGGFDGKLLHGYYHSFYLSDQLFESGMFKYGIKHGEWKNWYPDGKLKEITHWKNGRKNGNYFLYNNIGVLMASGKFKNDQLNGKFKTYDNFGKLSSTTNYKNGKEIVKQNKKTTIQTEKQLKKPNKQKDISKKGTVTKDKKTFGQKIKAIFRKKSKEAPKNTNQTAI